MIRAASPSVYVVGPLLRGLPRRADSPLTFAAFFGRHRLRGSIDPSAVAALASAIQTQEGFYPGSLAYQNNNPGNLVYVGQPGASPGAGGFAKFATYAQGYQALQNQITLDTSRGTDVNGNPVTTVSQLITSWAPPSQNDTAAYIASVSAQTGYDPDAPLSSLGAPSQLVAPVDAPPDQLTPVVDSSVSFPGFDLSSFENSTVDLSAVGLPSVPTPLLVGAGLVGLLALGKLF